MHEVMRERSERWRFWHHVGELKHLSGRRSTVQVAHILGEMACMAYARGSQERLIGTAPKLEAGPHAVQYIVW